MRNLDHEPGAHGIISVKKKLPLGKKLGPGPGSSGDPPSDKEGGKGRNEERDKTERVKT